MQAPSAPAFSGTYDFDILVDVDATHCATPNDQATYTGSVAGVALGGEGLVAAANQGAVFDALAKVLGADVP